MNDNVVLLGDSGSYFCGPDAPSPWLDDPAQAMQFSSPSEAWRYAKDLALEQAEYLQNRPVELFSYDPISQDARRVVTTDDNRAALKAPWKRAFAEPLPVSIPDGASNPDDARERMLDYLNDADWQAVRALGGRSFGFDSSFWLEAHRYQSIFPDDFRTMWTSVVPPDIDCPDLSTPRWQNALASLSRDGGVNEVAPTTPERSDSVDAEAERSFEPPRYVAQHFVFSLGSYYYKQRPDVLAFSVRGQSFRAGDDSVLTATAIVELAEQRQWPSLRVRGSTAFRRAVWTAAAERGLRVSGYSPTAGEVAVLAQSSSPDGRSASHSAEVPSGRELLSGVVVDHGEVPYQHDGSNSPSYYVTLRADDGREATHWGVGLGDEMQRQLVSPGDRVSLKRVGKTAVPVTRTVHDASGDVSYKKEEVAQRTAWEARVDSRAAPTLGADRSSRSSGDPELDRAFALIEARMAGMSTAERKEFRRHFDQARSRLERSPTVRVASRVGRSDAPSRSDRSR